MWPNSDLITLKNQLPKNIIRRSIPDGNAGTIATIEALRVLVDQSKRDFTVRTLASKIIRDAGCSSKDYFCYGQAIHNFVHHNVLYIHDAPSVETLVSSLKLLETKAGDCDDQACLVASLAESIGIPARFTCIKSDEKKPDEFTHIFAQLRINGKWVTADTTEDHGFGWNPADRFPSQSWPSSHDAMEDMSGDAMNGLGAMNICCIGDVDEMCPMDSAMNLSGLGAGLGAVSNQAFVETTISNVINGAAYNELSAARSRLGNMVGMLADAKDKLDKITDPQKNAVAFDIWNRAQGAYSRERASMDKAIASYNALASDIQTYSYGAYKPQSLGGLGIAPLAIAGIAVAGGIALYLTASAFSNAVGAWRGDARASQGLLSQLSDVLKSSGLAISAVGDTTSKIGVVFIAVFAAYIGFKFLKKKGKI